MTPRQLLPMLAIPALLAGAGAAAETSPWYVGLTQTLAHDSNVFRLPDADALGSGTISATRLVGGLDLRPGRQHVYADLNLSRNRYASQSQLDFDGYGLNAGLEWETVGHVSGTVAASVERRLGSFNSFTAPTGQGSNLEDVKSVNALFRLGNYQSSRLWAEAELNWDEQRSAVDLGGIQTLFDIPATIGYERQLRTTGAGVGLKTRLGGSLVLGAGLHTSRGDEAYDLRSLTGAVTPIDDRFTRHDLDFTGNWFASGASTVFGRLSYGRTSADAGTFRRDRKGWTGVVKWTWVPTGKLRTETRLAHETNSRQRATELDTASEPVSSIDLSAAYAISAKLSANAGLRLASRSLDSGSPGDGSDRRQTISAGIDWAALRNLSLGCALARESRNASVAAGGYSANFGSCTVRAVLQ